MKASIHVYPWDLADVGVDAVLDELAGLGFRGIHVASVYHPIAALSVRAPRRRLMYVDRGAVFFPARAERYGRIRPNVWQEKAVLDAWPSVAARAGAMGLDVTAWTLMLFQPWMAVQYPDCARRSASGDAAPSCVCAASPDVREYLVALVTDLATQFPLEAFELEAIGNLEFDHGWVRPRILADISPWASRLLKLCFCSSCKARATAEGIDADGLQARVHAELRRVLDPDPGSPADRHDEWTSRDAEYARFSDLQENTAPDLVAKLREALNSVSPRTRIGLHIEDMGARLEAALPDIGVLVTTGEMTPQLSGRLSALKRRQPGLRVSNIHLRGPIAGLSRRLVIARPPDEVLATLHGSPVDEVSVYNYGLITRENLRTAVAKLRRDGVN
jgi:hypothetical protein